MGVVKADKLKNGNIYFDDGYQFTVKYYFKIASLWRQIKVIQNEILKWSFFLSTFKKVPYWGDWVKIWDALCHVEVFALPLK